MCLRSRFTAEMAFTSGVSPLDGCSNDTPKLVIVCIYVHVLYVHTAVLCVK